MGLTYAERDAKVLDDKLSFLAALAETGSVTKAIALTGVKVRTLYGLKKSDEEFAKQWEAALDAGVDQLIDEARRRAYDGVEEQVFDKNGQLTGVRKKFSDILLMFLIKAKRPEYRDRYGVEMTGKDGGPIEVTGGISALIGMAKQNEALRAPAGEQSGAIEGTFERVPDGEDAVAGGSRALRAPTSGDESDEATAEVP